ncbi:MAG: hypothetical protein LBI74_05515 [Synergistaceae bacterium]|jgi:hypothetical protein|nr:hypothetical protein [Synergistaceae bacterium]
MKEICSERPEFGAVDIEITDETKEPEYAGRFDYYYVPTFFVDGEKIHEGVPSREAIVKIDALIKRFNDMTGLLAK